MAATMARPLGGVPWLRVSHAYRKESIGPRSVSGRSDDELGFRGVVRDPAQCHPRRISTRPWGGVRRRRDELPVDASQLDHDPLLVTGGGGDRDLPGRPPILGAYLYAEDVVRPKHEVELGLTVVQDRVHEQGLDAAPSPVGQPPHESVGDGGQRDDGGLVERGMDLRATGALGLDLLHVRDSKAASPGASRTRPTALTYRSCSRE